MAPTAIVHGSTGQLAVATGIVGLLGLVFILLFYVLGQPFGSLNDACIGLTAILSGLLSLQFRAESLGAVGATGWGLTAFAVAGAIVVAVGAGLVISGIRGWYAAGLYMAAGNALIGVWLLGTAATAVVGAPWSGSLITFGWIVSVIMLPGFAAVPGLIQGLDAWQSPTWHLANLGQTGAIGYLVFYPVWCLLAGRALLVG
jgi:hypothetical protein